MHSAVAKLLIGLTGALLLAPPSIAQNREGQALKGLPQGQPGLHALGERTSQEGKLQGVSDSAASPTRAQIYSYRALSAIDLPNLERALDRNGADGYHLVALNASLNGNLVAVLEKVPGNESFQYQVIVGAWAHLRIVHNDTPIIDLLNEAGKQGFRFVPNSVLPGKGVSAAVVIERAPDSNARYEYRIYSPQVPTNSKFEKDLAEGQKEGFSLVFYGTAGRGPSTLLEKRDDENTPARIEARELRRFGSPPKDLLKRLQTEVDKGYVPVAISPWNDFNALNVSFWLEKTAGLNLRVVSFENKSGAELSLLRGAYEGLANELNKAAAGGYSMVALPIVSRGLRGSILAKFAWRLAAVTSQSPTATTYRVVAADSLPELNARIKAAAGEGFRVIPGSLIADSAILMERSGAQLK